MNNNVQIKYSKHLVGKLQINLFIYKMAQLKITNTEKLLNPITDEIDKGSIDSIIPIDLNSAALKSLDLEMFGKSKKLQNYRSEFYDDYQLKQQQKVMDSLKTQEEKTDYLKLWDCKIEYLTL